MRDLGNKIVTYGFVLLLAGAGVINAVWPEQGFSETENRYLKRQPEFSLTAFLDGSYGRDYEEALSDQFPYRNHWVTLNVLSERMMGKTAINGVYIGRENYLLEKFEREDLQTGQSSQNISLAAEALTEWRQILGSDHVRVMMVPSAGRILQEKLPLFAAPYDQDEVTEWLKQAAAQPELFVPVGTVLADHRGEDIYYRTDHHWTSLGAYYGYTAWAASIGMEAMAPEEFKVTEADREFLGTLQSKLNSPARPDPIHIYEPKTAVQYEVYYDLADLPEDTLYSFDALKTKDKYRVFLDGNHALTRIENLTLKAGRTDAADGQRLLIIKDSFAHSFAPFAVNHFDTTYMIDLRYYNGNIRDFMKEHQITDLLLLYQIPGFCTERTVGKL